MFSTSCINAHHDVTTFEVGEIVSKINTAYLKDGTWLFRFFNEIKNSLKLYPKYYTFKSFFYFLTNVSLNYPANIYIFKVSNRITRNRFEICSKLTIKTPEPRSSLIC